MLKHTVPHSSESPDMVEFCVKSKHRFRIQLKNSSGSIYKLKTLFIYWPNNKDDDRCFIVVNRKEKGDKKTVKECDEQVCMEKNTIKKKTDVEKYFENETRTTKAKIKKRYEFKEIIG